MNMESGYKQSIRLQEDVEINNLSFFGLRYFFYSFFSNKNILVQNVKLKEIHKLISCQIDFKIIDS